jgi:hypothetical protein
MSVHRNLAYLASESEGERRFRTTWEHLVPDLDLEQEYEGGTGRYRLDFAHLPTRTAIEIDGQLGHASAREIARDRRRARALEDLGWRFRRFGGLEVMRAPERCVIDAAAFLRRRQREQAFRLMLPQARPEPTNASAIPRSPAPGSAQAEAPSIQASSALPTPGISILPDSALAFAGQAASSHTAPGTARSRRSRRHPLRWAVLAGCAYVSADVLLLRLLTGVPALPDLPARVPAGQPLYQATWTQGANGWQFGNQWHLQQGRLVSSQDAASLLWAPVSLDTASYAVEAAIRFLWHTDRSPFTGPGLLVRGDGKRRGYAGLCASLPVQGTTLMIQALHAGAGDLAHSAELVAMTDLAPRSPLLDGLWHRLRFEAHGTGLAFSLDGATPLRVLDSTYPRGGAVGLIACGCQIAVKEFTVTAL